MVQRYCTLVTLFLKLLGIEVARHICSEDSCAQNHIIGSIVILVDLYAEVSLVLLETCSLKLDSIDVGAEHFIREGYLVEKRVALIITHVSPTIDQFSAQDCVNKQAIWVGVVNLVQFPMVPIPFVVV